MKVLVTGGAGYVGTTLIPMLLHNNHKVICYDNLTWGAQHLLHVMRHPHFELIHGQINNTNELTRLAYEVDCAIHLASLVGYPACKKAPDEAEIVNVAGMQSLTSALPSSTPILFASTGSCYGHVPSGQCDENTPLESKTVYGMTKARAETLLQRRGNYVILRFATAFGISPRMRLDLLVNDFCYQAAANRSLVLYESHYRRTFIHVHDMARAFLHALDHYDTMKNEIYNVGHESMNCTKLELARCIRNFVDEFYLAIAENGHDEDQRNYEVNYAKLRATGFMPEVSLDAGISELVNLFKYLRVNNPYANV